MLKEGDLLDNTYKIIGQIGSGGGGIIYKAEHMRLKKDVVVKLIRENVKGKLDERAEADILKKLKHTYLPQVYDFLTIDDSVYTIMDFIPGKSFEDEINAGRKFTQKEVIKWAGQLCEALKYLHEQNPPIIHSDIKPANIMLTPNDNICLIDFNISLIFDEGENSALGKSDGYSPPEQYIRKNTLINKKTYSDSDYSETVFLDENDINETEVMNTVLMNNEIPKVVKQNNPSNKPKIDERSDIYSLGATLYHLATNQKPNISINKIKPIDKCGVQLSDGLKYIISKSIEFNPHERFSSAAQMLNAVKDINKLDKRYKQHMAKQRLTGIVLFLFLCFFSLLAFKGHTTMGEEKLEKYYNLIEDSQKALISGDYETSISLANSAMTVFENKIDAYYQTSLSLLSQGKYDECIEYIKNIAEIPFSIGSHSDKIKRADLDFIMANALFYKEDYDNAIRYYEKSVGKNEDNSQYYRDYVISLARTGKIESAEKVLNEAIDKGLNDTGIKLVKAEISLVKKDYLNAEGLFKEVLSSNNDESINERIYITLAKLYKEASSSIDDYQNKEISILEAAIEKLPIDKNYVVTEMLGDAYARKAQTDIANSKLYYEKAANCFLELLNRGYSRFYVMNNIAIIYQNMGEYEKSEEVLLQMKLKFPDDYRVYMQLAFLYADIQQTVSNDKRSYDLAYSNYQLAMDYYTDASRNNESDMRMDMLQGMMEDIIAGGWLR